MKRKDIHVFKLVHRYINVDPNFCIKTKLNEIEFVKLIKVLQRKAVDMKETFALAPSEMAELLLQYDENRAFPNEEDIKELALRGDDSFDYIEVDLYNIWEASNIVITDADLQSKQYYNENITQMIKNYIVEDSII